MKEFQMTDMNHTAAIRVIYPAKQGKESELLTLVRKHWPLLKKSHLVADQPAQIYRATGNKAESVSFVEEFSWKHQDSQSIALRTPAVIELWRLMTPLLDVSRRPNINPDEAGS